MISICISWWECVIIFVGYGVICMVFGAALVGFPKREHQEVDNVIKCRDCANKYSKDMKMFCMERVSSLRPDGYCECGRKD